MALLKSRTRSNIQNSTMFLSLKLFKKSFVRMCKARTLTANKSISSCKLVSVNRPKMPNPALFTSKSTRFFLQKSNS